MGETASCDFATCVFLIGVTNLQRRALVLACSSKILVHWRSAFSAHLLAWLRRSLRSAPVVVRFILIQPTGSRINSIVSRHVQRYLGSEHLQQLFERFVFKPSVWGCVEILVIGVVVQVFEIWDAFGSRGLVHVPDQI